MSAYDKLLLLIAAAQLEMLISIAQQTANNQEQREQVQKLATDSLAKIKELTKELEEEANG